ncbi:kinase-like domain-containing protein [Phycomyces blakesleeanus]
MAYYYARAVRSVSRKNVPFVKMQNIGLFLQAAHELGLQSSELFQTVDLYEAKDMIAVTNTILTLARVNAKHQPSADHLMAHFQTGKSMLLSSNNPTSSKEQSTKQPSVRYRRATDVRKVFNVEPSILSDKKTNQHHIKETKHETPSPSPSPSIIGSTKDHTNYQKKEIKDENENDTLRATLRLTIPATNPTKNSAKLSSDSGYSTLNRPPSMILESLAETPTKKMLTKPVMLTKQQSSPLLSVPIDPKKNSLKSSGPSISNSNSDNTPGESLAPSPGQPSRSTPMNSLPRQHLKRKTSQSIHSRASRSEASLVHSTSIKRPDNIKVVLRKEDGSIEAHYQLGNSIGKGQFGTVYRALDMQTGEIVAIKRIKVENVDMDNDIMLEVELLKSMASSSIVRYIGFVRDEEHLNIVLEYAENGSLLSTLKAFGSLPEKLVGSFTHKILTGLNYLHAHDVVHRDLKAANILTTKTGEVKLTDFGVSFNLRLKQDEADILAGTPYWMAPEIIELEGASTKSDIWSLGCTIVELLTGKPPYANLISMSALYHIVEDDHPPLPTTLSKPLKDFLLACFQKNPSNRPTAKELLQHPWMIPLAKLHPPRPSPQSTKRSSVAIKPITPSPLPSPSPSPSPGASEVKGEQKIPSHPPLSHRSQTCPELDLGQLTDDKNLLDMSYILEYIKSNPIMDTQRAYIETKTITKHQFVKSNFETAIVCKVCQRVL